MKILDVFKRMTTRRMVFFLIFLVFSILWAYAIFGFSSNTATESLEQSGAVTKFIIRLHEPDFDSLTESEQEALIREYHKIVRKTAHFCAFALLGFLTYFCVGSIKYLPHGLLVQATISIPFCALFAVTDEIHQKFVEGRSCKLMDVGIDTCGAVFGTLCAVILSLFYRWRINKKT